MPFLGWVSSRRLRSFMNRSRSSARSMLSGEVPMIAEGWRRVEAKFPGVPARRLLGELIRAQIGEMVNDLIAETERRVAEAGVETVDDVRAAGKPLVGFSDAMREAERDLKRFMYANLYHHPRQRAAAEVQERYHLHHPMHDAAS